MSSRCADRLFVRRLKQAGIAVVKTLADFDWSFNAKVPKVPASAAAPCPWRPSARWRRSLARSSRRVALGADHIRSRRATNLVLERLRLQPVVEFGLAAIKRCRIIVRLDVFRSADAWGGAHRSQDVGVRSSLRSRGFSAGGTSRAAVKRARDRSVVLRSTSRTPARACPDTASSLVPGLYR